MFANLPVTTSAILSVCHCLASTSVQIFHLAPYPPALTTATCPCVTSQNQHPYAAEAAAHHCPGAKHRELLCSHLLKAGPEMDGPNAFVFPPTYCKIVPFPSKHPQPTSLTSSALLLWGNFFSSYGSDPEAMFPWLRISTFSLPAFLSSTVSVTVSTTRLLREDKYKN